VKKLNFFIPLICGLLAAVGHADAAESVEIETEAGRLVTAHLAMPESDAKTVGVIVIHENRGLNDWAKSVADTLAENGFIAIAPDLLSGAAPNGGGTADFASSDDARTAIGTLDPDQITADLKAVTTYLHEQPAVTQVSVSGFCWGGTQSFRFATNEASLSAAYVFYGSGPPAEDIARITVPVYGFYAENDARINATIPDTEAATAAAGVTYEHETYPGVGHAFLRSVAESANPTEVEQASFDAAWARWLNRLDGQNAVTPVSPQGKSPTTWGETKDKD
jgi:carboxymethylenebutenolidase